MKTNLKKKIAFKLAGLMCIAAAAVMAAGVTQYLKYNQVILKGERDSKLLDQLAAAVHENTLIHQIQVGRSEDVRQTLVFSLSHDLATVEPTAKPAGDAIGDFAKGVADRIAKQQKANPDDYRIRGSAEQSTSSQVVGQTVAFKPSL